MTDEKTKAVVTNAAVAATVATAMPSSGGSAGQPALPLNVWVCQTCSAHNPDSHARCATCKAFPLTVFTTTKWQEQERKVARIRRKFQPAKTTTAKPASLTQAEVDALNANYRQSKNATAKAASLTQAEVEALNDRWSLRKPLGLGQPEVAALKAKEKEKEKTDASTSGSSTFDPYTVLLESNRPWTCGKCSVENSPINIRCKTCKTVNPDYAATSTPSSPDDRNDSKKNQVSRRGMPLEEFYSLVENENEKKKQVQRPSGVSQEQSLGRAEKPQELAIEDDATKPTPAVPPIKSTLLEAQSLTVAALDKNKQEWSCKVCTFQNPMSNRICEVCCKTWVCPIGKYSFLGEMLECDCCRPAQKQPPALLRANDWIAQQPPRVVETATQLVRLGLEDLKHSSLTEPKASASKTISKLCVNCKPGFCQCWVCTQCVTFNQVHTTTCLACHANKVVDSKVNSVEFHSHHSQNEKSIVFRAWQCKCVTSTLHDPNTVYCVRCDSVHPQRINIKSLFGTPTPNNICPRCRKTNDCACWSCPQCAYWNPFTKARCNRCQHD